MDSVLLAAEIGNVDLEYIIIDGGSTDGSRELLEDYSRFLSYWCSEPDEGQYNAINKGFSRATGEIFAWINASDLYFPYTLATVKTIFQDYQNVNWITSLRKTCIREDGSFESMPTVIDFVSAELFLAGKLGGLSNSNFIQQESCFWRRELWELVGGKIDETWKFAGDFWLWGQFFQHSRCTGVEIPLAAFRYHSQQRSADNCYIKEVDILLKKFQEYPKEKFVSGHHSLLFQVITENNKQNQIKWQQEIQTDPIYVKCLYFWSGYFSKLRWKAANVSWLFIATIKYLIRSLRNKSSNG